MFASQFAYLVDSRNFWHGYRLYYFSEHTKKEEGREGRKAMIDRIRESAEQALMDRNYWIHEREFRGVRYLTRIETPTAGWGLWTDDQIINRALALTH